MNALLKPKYRQAYNVALTVAAAILVATLLLLVMGIRKPGAHVLSIGIGPPLTHPAMPTNTFSDVVSEAVESHGITNWKYKPFGDMQLSNTLRPPRWYYRAEIIGQRDGQEVVAVIDLAADGGGKWRLRQWSEP